MKYSTAYRLLLVSGALFCGAQFSSGGPVYEPIDGFRPTATSPGSSLFRHSDGSFYGVYSDILYRVSAAGEFTTFPPIPGLQYGRTLEARHLVEAADGSLWATRLLDEEGTGLNVFRFDPRREKAKTVSPLGTGLAAPSGLASDGRGFLWGTTKRGGAADRGIVYKIEERTGALTVMHSFVNGPERQPRRETLILHRHSLWGTNADEHGSMPAIFTIHATTGAYKEFGFAKDDRRLFGTGPLSDDGAGNLWCTTTAGAVVKVNTAAQTYAVVAEFEPPSNPQVFAVNPAPRRLVRDGQGNMWGATARGSLGGGSIFKVNIDTGIMTVVAEFEGFYNAGESIEVGELINDGAGHLWATAIYGGAPSFPNGPRAGSILKVNIATGAITTVVDFRALRLGAPSTALLADDAGNFWGTLRAYPGEVYGGAVFKINRDTAEVTLMGEFGRAPDASDGLFPGAALVSARDGNLWGVAGEWQTDGYGFIYKVDPVTWRMTPVVEFTGESGATAGAYPRGPLAADPEGQLWGTAMITSATAGIVNSFIFKLDPTTGQLLRVAELPIGPVVFGSLVYDDLDSFWGTLNTQRLFKVNANTGQLIIFETLNPSYYEDRLVSDGIGHLWGFHRAHSKIEPDDLFLLDARSGHVTKGFVFSGIARYPYGLCSDRKGNLWGTVGIGPLGREPDSREPQAGFGAVFKLDAGTRKLVFSHNFPGLSRRRAGVWTSPLTFDGADSFYGTTAESGTRGLGTIFTFTRASFTTLFEFTGIKGGVPGAFPASSRDQPSLVRHSDGNLYGSTFSGGVLPDGRPAGAGQFYRVRFGPTPMTLPAEEGNSSGITLRGTLNPNGATTAASFEFGVDPELATFSSISAGELPPRNKPKPVSAQISNLEPGQTYYFRVVGQNAENAQPQRGAILPFTTTAAE